LEAEFYACSEAVKEIPFIVQILMSRNSSAATYSSQGG
jgi:hypothetical protein